MSDQRARIPNFYKYSISERLRLLYERRVLSEEDYHLLMDEQQILRAPGADRLIENVVGVFGLPLALGLNLRVNDRDYVVPMVVEEASIVAAVSAAAKLARDQGGFSAECAESLLIGQVQIVNVPHAAKAQGALLQRRQEILDLANSLHPKMVARGGGARDVEVHVHSLPESQQDMVVLHLLVDTCDAMGANLVNTMCEGVAPLVEKITGGQVFLRILSNLTDRSLVRACVRLPAAVLANNGYKGEEVRDGILLAQAFATTDPYRAATHNKGIMNGIDAVAIATGNDWRAIEAAAHAYASRGGRYTSLSKWHTGDDGALLGELEIPLKVGTVGGNLLSNPAVAVAQRILRVHSAKELAGVMAAVGLAQNLAALRALSTEGIQRGHMTLHARSVAVSAGAAPEIFETVVERLIESGDIKVWKARAIITELNERQPEGDVEALSQQPGYAAGHGKVILLGEHAVVYGAHAIAAPIPLAIQAKAETAPSGVELLIPRWGVEERFDAGAAPRDVLQECIAVILRELGALDRGLRIEVYPHIPRAMGLGGSAALAVAVTRAVARCLERSLSDDDVNRIAFQCERIAHGTPSGIDNTLATFGQFILFKKGEPATTTTLRPNVALPLVIGMSGVEGLTARMVAQVRTLWQRNERHYERIFNDIDNLAMQAAEAITTGNLQLLGDCMNLCHGLLNALQVSTWEIEEMVAAARGQGALGAKITGGGGGGSMIALCANAADAERVAAAIRTAGYRALVTEIG